MIVKGYSMTRRVLREILIGSFGLLYIVHDGIENFFMQLFPELQKRYKYNTGLNRFSHCKNTV